MYNDQKKVGHSSGGNWRRKEDDTSVMGGFYVTTCGHLNFAICTEKNS